MPRREPAAERRSAAKITIDSIDVGHVGPIIAATERELQTAVVTQTWEVVMADAGAVAVPKHVALHWIADSST
jgi:hypothetical protein